MSQIPEAKKLTHLHEGETHLWRGDLSPIGCAAVVNPADSVYLTGPAADSAGPAAQAIGDESPHHKEYLNH
jgi:hypothetical protein